MAKLSKQELKTLISEKIEDKDLQIELLEDIEDSMDESETVSKEEHESVLAELNDIKEKYRNRFLEVEEVEEAVEEIADDSSEEVKEEEVIDVQEI